MIFNDVVEWYNELSDLIISLEQFKTELVNIKQMDYVQSNSIMSKIISNEINTNNYNTYRSQTIIQLNNIKKAVQKINFVNLGKVIFTLEKVAIRDVETSRPLEELINIIEKCSNGLYEYINTENEIELSKKLQCLIMDIDGVVKAIDDIKYISEFLTVANKSIQQEFNYAETATLSIRLYDEVFTLKEISGHMEIIINIYERSCNIFEVSTTDYPLMPIKIETGSLFDMVLGHEKVMKFIGELLNRAIGFIHRNYTDEGKIKESSNKIEALKKNIELVKLCEELGMDMDNAKQILEQNADILCNEVYKLTTSSSKIAINGEIHNAGKKAGRALIEDRKVKYLSNSCENNEENYSALLE